MWPRVEPDVFPSAITYSMLALCSAACKALRFASTARGRGLRALTPPPRSSATGNYVMADDACRYGVQRCESAVQFEPTASGNRRLRSGPFDTAIRPDPWELVEAFAKESGFPGKALIQRRPSVHS